MLQYKRNQSAFTLIELLVVAIIVAVLAAVGIPLMAGQINRARLSEAEAGLGTIRTSLRAIQADLGQFPALVAGTSVVGNVAGLAANDLVGRWFEDNDYTISSTTTTYCITAVGDASGLEGVAVDTDANNNNQPVGLQRSMTQTGQIFTSTNCT